MDSREQPRAPRPAPAACFLALRCKRQMCTGTVHEPHVSAVSTPSPTSRACVWPAGGSQHEPRRNGALAVHARVAAGGGAGMSFCESVVVMVQWHGCPSAACLCSAEQLTAQRCKTNAQHAQELLLLPGPQRQVTRRGRHARQPRGCTLAAAVAMQNGRAFCLCPLPPAGHRGG